MKQRGTISFVFDDGYQETYQNAVPLLDRYQFPGVFAIPLDTTTLAERTGQAFAPVDQWLNLKERGHEIAAHSATHVDLATLTAEQLTQELKQPAEILAAVTIAYPGGSHDQRVVEQARNYYTAGRTVKRGFEQTKPSDPYRLHTFNWTRHNFSVPRANIAALWAYLTNRWLIETYHLVENKPSDALHTVATSAFAKHLAFVAKLTINVVTIRKVINEANRN